MPAALAAAFTLAMSRCTAFSPRYFTGPTQTTGVIGTIAPPSIACLKYSCVVFREGFDLLLEQNQLLARARLEAFQPLLDVGEEAGLGEFAVGDDVDAAIGLLAGRCP